MAGGEFSGARAVKFLYDPGSRSFLLGFWVLLLGSPVGLSQFLLIISRGKLCMFCVGLAQLFVGVRLSVFSFGLQRSVFV